ncbi:MAG: enoyl-CoA hydratase/isomerase family protein [Acidimicrobiia bacterium]
MTTVRSENVSPGVTVLTLDRPDRLNAMSRELVSDLHAALDTVAADRDCRVVVITGAGRGFCSGLDLKETGDAVAAAEGGPAGGMRAQQHIATLIPQLRRLPQPVIAAVNGPATGGGLALALACDVRIAADSARFNVAFVRVGLSGCDIGVSYLLPRLVGAARAFELMLTGRLIDAAEADRIGLVSKVVPDERVLDAALETAELIRANSPFGVWMTKEVMWSNLEAGSLQAAIDLENRTQLLASHSGDMREAITAFLEKRPADFTNREEHSA